MASQLPVVFDLQSPLCWLSPSQLLAASTQQTSRCSSLLCKLIADSTPFIQALRNVHHEPHRTGILQVFETEAWSAQSRRG